MEFQTLRINRGSPISHHMSSHTTISFISHCNKTQPTMPQATNILCYDDSIQSETLGDDCMIAVLASITMVLSWIDMYLHNNKKSTRRSTTYHCIKHRRRTIQSLHQEYGCLFSRAYQMNYEGFMALHDILQ